MIFIGHLAKLASKRGYSLLFQMGQAFQVVDGAFEVQCQHRAYHAHAGRHRFDSGARRRDTPLALLLCCRYRLLPAAFALDLDAPACLFQGHLTCCAGVAAIGTPIFAGIVVTRNGFKYRGVGNRSIRDGELAALVESGMVQVRDACRDGGQSRCGKKYTVPCIYRGPIDICGKIVISNHTPL